MLPPGPFFNATPVGAVIIDTEAVPAAVKLDTTLTLGDALAALVWLFRRGPGVPPPLRLDFLVFSSPGTEMRGPFRLLDDALEVDEEPVPLFFLLTAFPPS